MAVTQSTRLLLTRWSAEGDPFNRTQQDADHAILDNLVAIDVQDLLSNRPAPGVRGRFFTESAASAGLPGATWREDGTSWRSVGSRVVAASATDIGQVVRGAASQSADLTDWQNSAGTVLSSVDSAGGGHFVSAILGGGSGFNNHNGGFGAALSVQPYGGLASRSGIIVRGLGSQVGNLQEWQDSTGALLASVSPIGGVTTPVLSVVNGPNTSSSIFGQIPVGQGAGVAFLLIRDQSNNDLFRVMPTGQVFNQVNAAGTQAQITKGAASQSANLQEWQSSTAQINASVAADGSVFSRGFMQASSYSLHGQANRYGASSSAIVSVNTGAASNEGVIVRGVSSQSADLQQWQDLNINVLAKITAGGSLVVAPPSPRSAIGAAGQLSLTAFAVSPGAGESGVLPLAVRGAGSQSADLTEWQNSTGTVLAKVLPDGSINGATVFQGGPTLTTATVAMENGNLRVGPRSGSIGTAIVRFTPSGFVGTNSDASITCTGGDGVTSNAGTLQSNAQQLIVAGSSASVTPLNVTILTSPSANIQSWRIGSSASTPVAQITATGNVQGTGAYTTLSDASVKSHVRELVHDPLDVVRRLRPVHYDYIGGERDQVGFVAQEVEGVLPSAVTPWDRLHGVPDVDGRLGLRTDAILAYLVAAVQRIDSRVSVLERAA